ncbi:MAG: glutamate racemase [Patescibacteria group bacterium]|nr:glutamate racemase [Patescibacteria group bacterium]
MKIGIFDSGLGGLVIAKAIHKMLPAYDYVYLGDTKRMPYGNRSEEAVLEFTKEGVDYLFRKENCAIVVIACNTASAKALRKLQREYLLKNFPDRKVLGVLIPAAEECVKFKNVGILATRGTVSSNTFPKEIKKLNKEIKVFQNSAPMLASLAEEGRNNLAVPFIEKYLKPLLNKKLDALVLGCTHYVIFKKEIRKIVGKKIKIVSQDEIIPRKLKKYLERHREVTRKISCTRDVKILVTDKTDMVKKLTEEWFGKTKPKLVTI